MADNYVPIYEGTLNGIRESVAQGVVSSAVEAAVSQSLSENPLDASLVAALDQSKERVALLEKELASSVAGLGKSRVDKIEAIEKAATKYPRCCDLWQDSIGGMHCTECAQKTFTMLREIQNLLGVGKNGR